MIDVGIRMPRPAHTATVADGDVSGQVATSTGR
jgi:hypothetical protein